MRIAITSLKGLGGTFMEWSLYYLCNLNEGKMYRPDKDEWIPVVDNPVQKRNAHSHHKVHPIWRETKYAETKLPGAMIHDFIDITKDVEGHILFYPYVDGRWVKDLYGENEKMIKFLYDNDVKIITIRPDTPYPFLAERQSKTDEDSLLYLRIWLKDQVSSTRKIRELASFRVIGNIKKYIYHAREYHERISPMVVATFGDSHWQKDQEDCIMKVCDLLGFEIIPERLEKWRPIANEWKKINDKVSNWFEVQAPAIAKAIVENRKMDLSGMAKEIEIMSQITIMAYIMRDHGKRLILPSDDFPLDTQILHGFLK